MEVQSDSYPMVGGQGEYSYSKNSGPQKIAVEGSKEVLVAAISESLDLKNASSCYRIADLGCSVGPTTFFVVQNIIIQSVMNKYKSQNRTDKIPEFFVFFNDHIGNDFNSLFNNIPLQEKQYYAAGVPGSFHGRLFPKASLDFVYSSNAVHWLSKLPEELLVENSPTYNTGRIFYTNAPLEICEAYFSQFVKDLKCFLNARAQEIVPGGLMALVLPGRLDGIGMSHFSLATFLALESCLLDMTSEGKVSKDRMDKFNFPVYFPSPEELMKIITETNHDFFDIVKSETFQYKSSPFSKQECRAVSEEMVKKHFGVEILEELYDRYQVKISASESSLPISIKESTVIAILLLLKRKN